MLWLILTGGLGVVGYLYFSKKFSYFRNHGVPQEPGYFPFGSSNNWKIMSGKLAFTQITDELYEKYKHLKCVGYYVNFGEPVLLVNDLELAKKIMIKDFDHFSDRRKMRMDEDSNKYFANMVLTLEGESWKPIRSMITPIFTSGRLKGMLPIMHTITNQLTEHTAELIKNGETIKTKPIFAHLSFEMIMSTGFGIEVNAWKEMETNIFKKMANKYLGYDGSVMLMVKMIVAFALPWVAEKSKMRLMDGESEDFLANVMKQAIEQRKKEKGTSKRNDLVDLLIQALDEASINESEDTSTHNKTNATSSYLSKMSEEQKETLMISQALVMFLAAFDTTSNSLALTFHFLATNPECQEKLFEEINTAINDNDGNKELNYEQLQKLEYAEACLNESMRMYNFVGALERLCVKDYHIPEINFTVPKGMLVQIACMMQDDQYYPNAKQFNPDNFSEEAKKERSPYLFSSFGYGPRNCIGMRFAYLQMKMVLVHMIHSFKILPCEKTPKELDPDPMNASMLPKEELCVALEARV